MREDAPPTLTEGGLIRPGYNAELDELVRVGSDAKGLLARLEAAERERTRHRHRSRSASTRSSATTSR